MRVGREYGIIRVLTMKLIWNRVFNFVGRVGVALFALVLFIHGSTKNSTNVNNAAEEDIVDGWDKSCGGC